MTEEVRKAPVTIAHTPEYALTSPLELVQQGVSAFATDLRGAVADEHRHVARMIDGYVGLLERGGKRTRGVLTVAGYEMYGGSDHEVAAVAAGVVEAMHAYLLVVDDVADDSDLRRGGPTTHIFLRDYFSEQVAGDTLKLGIDSAQNTAMYAQHRAQCELLKLEKVPAEQRLLAAEVLNDGLARTGIGQALDMVAAYSDDITMQDILKIATYKTAYYSFLLPLQVGAALAGAPREELELFREYSLNAGLAFQLQDDIIGTFGTEAVTGKPSMSDIREGKKTLLMTMTLERAADADREVLFAALGNPNLEETHFQQCLDIIRATGTLDDVSAQVQTYSERACALLESSAPQHWPVDCIRKLQEMARFSASRNN